MAFAVPSGVASSNELDKFFDTAIKNQKQIDKIREAAAKQEKKAQAVIKKQEEELNELRKKIPNKEKCVGAYLHILDVAMSGFELRKGSEFSVFEVLENGCWVSVRGESDKISGLKLGEEHRFWRNGHEEVVTVSGKGYTMTNATDSRELRQRKFTPSSDPSECRLSVYWKEEGFQIPLSTISDFLGKYDFTEPDQCVPHSSDLAELADVWHANSQKEYPYSYTGAYLSQCTLLIKPNLLQMWLRVAAHRSLDHVSIVAHGATSSVYDSIGKDPVGYTQMFREKGLSGMHFARSPHLAHEYSSGDGSFLMCLHLQKRLVSDVQDGSLYTLSRHSDMKEKGRSYVQGENAITIHDGSILLPLGICRPC